MPGHKRLLLKLKFDLCVLTLVLRMQLGSLNVFVHVLNRLQHENCRTLTKHSKCSLVKESEGTTRSNDGQASHMPVKTSCNVTLFVNYKTKKG